MEYVLILNNPEYTKDVTLIPVVVGQVHQVSEVSMACMPDLSLAISRMR